MPKKGRSEEEILRVLREVAAEWLSRTPGVPEAGPPGQDSRMLVETLT